MRLLALLLLVGASACTEGLDTKKKGNAGSCSGGETRVAVVNELFFGRASAEGVAVGFDLDDRVSDAADVRGCHKPDFTSPTGTPGVDSAFAPLVPVLEATEAAAVEGLMHDSIRSGELLLAIELTGLDDAHEDDCVGVQVVRADGVPLIDTQGDLLDSQTLARHPTIPAGQTEAAWVSDGSFEANGMTMRLELQVLDEFLEFDLSSGKIRGELHEDGTITGVLAGAIPVSQILYEFDLGDIQIADLIKQVIPAAADLYNEETGECDALSITLEYEAIPAYLFD